MKLLNHFLSFFEKTLAIIIYFLSPLIVCICILILLLPWPKGAREKEDGEAW
jgi:hypothetical protein